MDISKLEADIAKRVRYFRIVNGISQHDVAKSLNVSFQQVQKYEKGLNRISSGKLVALSKVLGISVNDLIADDLEKSNILFDNKSHSFPKDSHELLSEFTKIRSKEVRKHIITLCRLFNQPYKQ